MNRDKEQRGAFARKNSNNETDVKLETKKSKRSRNQKWRQHNKIHYNSKKQKHTVALEGELRQLQPNHNCAV